MKTKQEALVEANTFVQRHSLMGTVEMMLIPVMWIESIFDKESKEELQKILADQKKM